MKNRNETEISVKLNFCCKYIRGIYEEENGNLFRIYPFEWQSNDYFFGHNHWIACQVNTDSAERLGLLAVGCWHTIIGQTCKLSVMFSSGVTNAIKWKAFDSSLQFYSVFKFNVILFDKQILFSEFILDFRFFLFIHKKCLIELNPELIIH